jgi:GntR family transcriptional regulator, transcriptional repressor for pyruvate dehydrogenase complex
MSLSSLRRSPLAELAVSQLREQVLSGQWPVGARLPAETELARLLGVGRSTVREAVRVLVHDGLLETRQGSGTFVRSVTADSGWEPLLRRAAILEVYEVRQALEVQAAGLAAARRTREDIAQINARLGEREQAGAAARDTAFVDADVAFHKAVVAAAHNPLLSEMFTSFTAVLREALIGVVSDDSLGMIDYSPAHVQLAAAVEAGDVAAAQRATHDHLDPTATALQSLTSASR